MSGERRKTNKHCTGTVPKIKYRNNTSSSLNEGNNTPRSLTNNLTSDWQRVDHTNFVRNSRRNTLPPKYQAMETAVDGQQLRQTGNAYINSNVNGTPATSSSTSRRNSSGTIPKCDNVSKCPDKKQVEDKLNQIREYLKITTSLMSSMKLGDDQKQGDGEYGSLEKMIADLKDSESKLVSICQHMNEDEVEVAEQDEVKENGELPSEASISHRNDLERVEQTYREIDSLKEQQLALLHLQQKAENKLREAKLAQERLLSSQRNCVNNMSNRNEKNLADIDETIRELEERSKRLNDPHRRQVMPEERVLTDRVDALQNQIMALHNANNDRQQLIDVLDNRDSELRSQHMELQGKLMELQNKKKQVDEIVVQLHSLDEGDEDDVGLQVRKIVSMKEQLSKLKDMLEIVQNTESVMLNQNSTAEEQALAYDICAKAENFLQNNTDVHKQSAPSESNFSLCYDNNTASSRNEHRHKQINQTASDHQGARPKQAAIDEKMSVHAELEAKRRELEAIMGKHKAGTSNLNHDVGSDHKMEFGNTSNTFFDPANGQWVISHQNENSSDRFSSVEGSDDVNEFSDLSPQQNHLPTFRVTPDSKHTRPEPNPRIEYTQPSDYERLQSVTRTPERNIRSSSISNYDYPRDRARSNSIQDNKNQVQKQLELIKSVCESMLEQSSNNQQSNVQQLRNNLTPSPIYSEPRRFASPNGHVMNALNVVNANVDPWTPNGNPPSDLPSCPNWLAANTLQSQAFMLNTLNQCCHMLWIQQREMAALRNAVTSLQERLDHCPPCEGPSHLVSPAQHSNPMEPRSSNQHRNLQKTNHVSSACSMPNLNHYNMPPTNLVDPAAYNHPVNNMQQSARLLDSALNNAINPHPHAADFTNNMLHVNGTINQPLPGQVWNGPALNNQVAPGNRANNYWDNFRSYSRQNLLSTKSNEGLHNLAVAIERPSNTSHPFPPSKSNSEQESGSTSQENTPRRRANVQAKRPGNLKKVVIPPPDVLNVNHNLTRGAEQQVEHLPENRQVVSTEDDHSASYQSYLNNAFGGNSNNETVPNHVKITEDHIIKDCIPENCRQRNEWHDDVDNEQQLPKSKLFEECRENVYKEVATLISANEARPHFLIQLFRDLQMISSDTLRLKILQSIQGVITHSTQTVSTQASSSNEQASGSHSVQPNGYFTFQPTIWSKAPRTSTVDKNRSTLIIQEADIHDALKDIIPFLNDHEEETIDQHFLMALKQMLINSDSFQGVVKDPIFHKHFSNVLDEVLEQYLDKKFKDVRMHLLQTLGDMLRSELSFIQLIQETCPENCESNNNLELATNHLPYISNPVYDFQPPEVNHFQSVNSSLQMVNSTITPIENGDLAEADQSRVEDEDVEEEGAVGGFLDVSQELVPGSSSSSNQIQVNGEDVDIPTIDFPGNIEQPECQFVKQGLDQVPTRLACRSKSRSNTPSRDRSNSSRSEHHSDHF